MLPWTEKKTGEDEEWNLKPNHPFFLMHHPTGWSFTVEEGKGEFLPIFSTLHEIPGVNGVKQTRTGGDSSLARTEAADRGFTVLPRDLGYLARWRCRGGGFHYQNVYAKPKKLGNSVIWKTDTRGWNQWRRDLMKSGDIEDPDIDQLEYMIEREERSADRLVRDQHLPEVERELKRVKKRVSDMRKAIKKIGKRLK